MRRLAVIASRKRRKMIRVPFSYPEITQEDKNAVLKVLDSQWLTGGQRTVEFEEKFAKYVGVKYAVAVNSGTAALHLAMMALGIKSGDEVIAPTLTFVATANAAIFCGAKPVLADIDEETLNISPQDIEKKITKRTRAIVPVHLAGEPCDMDAILRIALEHNLFVVEDCAHSLGSAYRGVQTGAMSECSCFSSYATKPLCTGEGGMLATSSDEIAKRVRLMRSHGMSKEAFERSQSASWRYDIVELGWNYRLTEAQSALGISQLSRLNQMNLKRAWIAEYYTRELGKIKGIITPKLAGNRISSWHLYIIRVVEKEFGMSRDRLFSELAKIGVECSVHYTPIHLLSYYRQKYGYKLGDFPIADRLFSEVLSLPIYSLMSKEQMEYVVQCIKELAG